MEYTYAVLELLDALVGDSSPVTIPSEIEYSQRAAAAANYLLDAGLAEHELCESSLKKAVERFQLVRLGPDTDRFIPLMGWCLLAQDEEILSQILLWASLRRMAPLDVVTAAEKYMREWLHNPKWVWPKGAALKQLLPSST